MSRPRILVVEDNAVLQRVIQLLAVKFSVDARIVSSGKDALSALSEDGSDYSMVLMDWRLPDMDGLQCTRLIRSNENADLKPIPIVAMTAHADDEHKRVCLENGMNDYMSKPFSHEQFGDVLNRWIAYRAS